MRYWQLESRRPYGHGNHHRRGFVGFHGGYYPYYDSGYYDDYGYYGDDDVCYYSRNTAPRYAQATEIAGGLTETQELPAVDRARDQLRFRAE